MGSGNLTCTDNDALCVYCHEIITEEWMIEHARLSNEDGQKMLVACPHCHRNIEITVMVSVWRYAVRVPEDET